MTTKRIVQPLKWHGGKHYLAKWIISLMPPRCNNPNTPHKNDAGWLHYCEPYFGGGSVLLANDPVGISEVVNDINWNLTNFWQVLQDTTTFADFCRILTATPFSEADWERASDFVTGEPVGNAARFFVFCRQSLAGRMDSFASLSRLRTRCGMNEQASAWLTAIDGLPVVHERLQRVVILNHDALDVIRQQDGIRTLFYLDPPYLDVTRATENVYEFEMTSRQHEEMLDVVNNCAGRVMISGYPSELYEQRLAQWNRHEFEIPNQAAGGKEKRIMTEVVWCNF